MFVDVANSHWLGGHFPLAARRISALEKKAKAKVRSGDPAVCVWSPAPHQHKSKQAKANRKVIGDLRKEKWLIASSTPQPGFIPRLAYSGMGKQGGFGGAHANSDLAGAGSASVLEFATSYFKAP